MLNKDCNECSSVRGEGGIYDMYSAMHKYVELVSTNPDYKLTYGHFGDHFPCSVQEFCAQGGDKRKGIALFGQRLISASELPIFDW